MSWVYRSADAFCFVPDSQEAFGMVYLEAMATGLPIVASDDPIRRALVGGQGFFADPHDVSLVSKALESALANGPVSYTKELKSYSLPNVINQIEKELHDLTQS
jgi:glycosyltransferase involved in cell wall biosynthesis